MYFYSSLSPLRATNIAVAIVWRAITVLEAIQKRNHEPIYKTYTKIEAKRLRATTIAVAIVGRAITLYLGSKREKSNIAIAILDKWRIW